MRKLKSSLLLCLSLFLISCGSQTAVSSDHAAEQSEETPAVLPDNTSSADEQTGDSSDQESGSHPAEHSEVLVVYFSATGTTRGVAERIAKITGADLYEIIPAEPYTSDDLNYNDANSRTTKEQNDKSVRPDIAGEKINLSGYTHIYIGFPIWWGEEPRIMDTFVENYDFTGITMIPFCTSASSGIGNSASNMKSLAGTGTWLDGARHSGNISEEDLQDWINGLK